MNATSKYAPPPPAVIRAALSNEQITRAVSATFVPIKSIDALRNKLKQDEHNAQVLLDRAQRRLAAIAAVDKLPLNERIDFAADLADFYAELDTREDL